MASLNKHIRWLNGEIARWVDSGIIADSHAAAIRQLYPAEHAARPWALIVFSGLGAVVIGLGVILLFAYNWHAMPKFTKLAIVFAAVIISHSAGIALFFRSDRFKTLGEALTILGTMFFGAGIWLIAQIYHIQEHFPNAFLYWGLGALALAWAMPSMVQAILAAILFTVWTGVEAVEFHKAMCFAIPLMLSLWLLAVINRSRLLLAVLILAMGFLMAFLIGATEGDAVFIVLFSIAALYVALGLLAGRFGRFPQAAPILQFFGLAAYLVMLYLLTFPDLADGMLTDNRIPHALRLMYSLPTLLLAIAAWLIVPWLASPLNAKARLADYHLDYFLIPLLLILCYSYSFFTAHIDNWPAAAPFSLAFLIHALAMMARGCRDTEPAPAIIGSLLLVALIIARYVDLFESLAARGLVFIIVGILLFLQGIFYVRSKRKKLKEQAA